MNKKRIFSRLSVPTIFLMSATVLSACSASGDFKSNPQSLAQLKQTASQDESLLKDKRALFASLSAAFDSNPTATTKIMLDAWKYTLTNAMILEKPLNQSLFTRAFGPNKTKDDIEPSSGVRGLRLAKRYGENTASIINNALKLDKQTVENFNINFKTRDDFNIQVRLKASGTYKKEQIKTYLSQIGLQENELKDEGTIEAQLIYTYTKPQQGLFSKKSFSSAPLSINFNTTLNLKIIGVDELTRKLLASSFVQKLADESFSDQAIDLLPYVLYSIQ